MTNKALIRRPWVVVATLAVAPVLCKRRNRSGCPPSQAPAAAALPLDAQAPGPASSVEAQRRPEKTLILFRCKRYHRPRQVLRQHRGGVLEEWDQRAASKDRLSGEDLGRTSTRCSLEGLLTKE